MSKAIIVSEEPQSVCNILNGIKKCLINTKSIPVGTKVYIYCTKEQYLFGKVGCGFYVPKKCNKKNYVYDMGDNPIFINEKILKAINFNGKVVASFVVSKCEEVLINYMGWGYIILNNKLKEIDRQIIPIPKGEKRKICKLSKDSCVDMGKLYDYGKWTDFVKGQRYKKLYTWHISQLEIFDEPKELGEFQKYGMFKWVFDHCHSQWVDDNWHKLIYVQKAPQNYVYVEEI